MSGKPIDPTSRSSAPPTVVLLGPENRTKELERALRAVGVEILGPMASEARPPEIVVVGVDAQDRADVTRRVLESGSNAYLTWPPCASPEEGGELLALADESGIVVGVEPPAPVAAWLEARPRGWVARIVSFTSVAGPGNESAQLMWSRRLAGALHLCIQLVGSQEVTRIDAQTDPLSGSLDKRALGFCLRFQNGAYAQVLLRVSASDAASGVSLFASGGGIAMEASAFNTLPLLAPSEAGSRARAVSQEHDVVRFVEAVRAGSDAEFALQDALDTMRLVEAVQNRLR